MQDVSTAQVMSTVDLCPGSEPTNLGYQSGARGPCSHPFFFFFLALRIMMNGSDPNGLVTGARDFVMLGT